MKTVKWTDKNGKNRQAILRDQDSEGLAPHIGIKVEPPNLDLIDWNKKKIQLHNELLRRDLINFDNVQDQQNGILASLRAVFLPDILALYRGK